jgi:hypothetical protein
MFKELNISICLIIFVVISSEGQISRHFEVTERKNINLVSLNFSSYKGVSQISRSYHGVPLYADAELGKVNILPSFTHNLSDGILYAQLEHKNVESESLSKNLSYRLFASGDDDFDHKWEVGLDPNFLYNLHFQFGIGKARIDFSNLPISNCIVKTASADVFLNYSKKVSNSVNMDTLSEAINMGSLYAKDLQFSNARLMMFDVNYGSVNLTFDDAMAGVSQINAMVGAGSVNIKLPPTNLPYFIKIKSTAMCKTKVPSNLEKIDDDTYVSKGYNKDAKNLMTFLIDVSVGSVSLE